MSGDETEIGARCLKLCREVIWIANDPRAPYTLRGVLYGFHPRSGFPFVYPQQLHLYAEFYGEAGEYDVWFHQVRLLTTDDGVIFDEVEEAAFGPFVLQLQPDQFVQARQYVLSKVAFPDAGLYEFRLHVSGVTDPLVSERLFLEG